MKVFVTDGFPLPLPEGHRFPAAKYALARQLLRERGLPVEILVPDAASDDDLLLAHTPEYLAKVTAGRLSDAEQRRIGLPWSPELVERARRSVGGTLAACRAALSGRVAVNLAGGTHHAFADAGEGFCLFNDAAVAVRALRRDGRIDRAVVIDLDVHQGNGTARLFQGDDQTFTFSVHGANNFPARKEQSDLDVGLPDGVGDADFLAAVEQGTWEALHRSRAELALYLAGADPFEGDRLGRMKVTKAGLFRRSQIVLEACAARGVPVAVAMAGGYAADVRDTAEIYADTVAAALAWA